MLPPGNQEIITTYVENALLIDLALSALTPQNGQTYINNLSTFANELFKCVWPFCWVGSRRVKTRVHEILDYKIGAIALFALLVRNVIIYCSSVWMNNYYLFVFSGTIDESMSVRSFVRQQQLSLRNRFLVFHKMWHVSGQ